MLREPSVEGVLNLVKYEIQQIETRDQGRREVDVPRDGEVDVVFRAYRIGRSEDGRPGIESGDNTCLCDRYSLLFLKRHWYDHIY